MAFVGVAVWSPHVAVVAVVMVAATTLLLRAIWAGAAGMRLPVVFYGTVITAMVVSSSATLGGPLAGAVAAAIGAPLFYVSDSSLALNRFRRPIPHASLLTLGVYWLGQLGIASPAAPGTRYGPNAARAQRVRAIHPIALQGPEEAEAIEDRVHPAHGDAVVAIVR